MVLKLTARIEKLLGKGGMAVLEKVFGIILLAIAIKLFASMKVKGTMTTTTTMILSLVPILSAHFHDTAPILT